VKIRLFGKSIVPGEVCVTEQQSVAASLPVEGIEIPDGFRVFRGVEISTPKGHLLAYGLKDDSWNRWARNNYLDLFEVLESVRQDYHLK
jgi:hypothetical protein